MKTKNKLSYKEIVTKVKELQYKIQQCKLEGSYINYSDYIKELGYWRNVLFTIKKRRKKKRLLYEN